MFSLACASFSSPPAHPIPIQSDPLPQFQFPNPSSSFFSDHPLPSLRNLVTPQNKRIRKRETRAASLTSPETASVSHPRPPSGLRIANRDKKNDPTLPRPYRSFSALILRCRDTELVGQEKSRFQYVTIGFPLLRSDLDLGK